MRQKPAAGADVSGADKQGKRAGIGRSLRTLRRVGPYLWPDGETWVKRRVVLSLLALLAAKVVSAFTPFLYKAAVDSLAQDARGEAWLLAYGAIGLTIAYGVARLGNTGFSELRDAIFVRVGQRALRKLALETFTHIHRLSMRYHITRKTGGLSRVIERGVKGVDFLLRFMLLSVGPLILELSLVTLIFALVFDWRYALVVLVTIAAYVTYTFKVTELRVKIRRQMNEQDTDANQKAIDSLLNFETVKYFAAEKWEAARYDAAMAGYEKAAVKTGLSLSALNFGQSAIISTGLVIVMAMAAAGVQSG
ncbi:MAG: metal ABC transporter permease, partial [Rhodobacteraceae bacterium]|nr:metal ABC transporter permease [Paracoccaceae bacterium]